MTRAEIDKLQAGPEADVMCARAMGAKVNPLPRNGGIVISARNGKPLVARVDEDGDIWLEPFSPSTEIADAMVLYDWLVVHRGSMQLTSCTTARGDVVHFAGTRPIAHADTKQMAIVRAFLSLTAPLADRGTA